MKKTATWVLVIAFIVFLIDWGVMGIKLLDNDYNIMLEAYIGFVCWVFIIISIFVRAITDRCPRCGKVRITKGAYCSYCGEKIK